MNKSSILIILLRFTLLFIPLIFFLTLTQAQNKPTNASTDSIRTTRLQDVEVTSKAALTSKTVLSTEATGSPASVSLVGRDYIAKQSVLSYGDLLRPLAGINVANYQQEDKQINTFTPAAYAQMQLRPTARLKVTLSGRYDYLFYNIKTGSIDGDTANLNSTPHTGFLVQRQV